MNKINQLLQETEPKVVAWRRHLHQNPELSFKEEKTSQFVYDALCALGNLEVSRPTPTSVMARLIGAKPGEVLAIRADMDALPLQEETELEFASQNPGVMHACGHDSHTAMLLGTASILSKFQAEINGEIRFLFQHAEESFPGGSRQMMAAGAMDGVDKIIGLHVMSHLQTGKIGIVYGPAMAASDTFEITVIGKGGHSSQPHMTIDPVVIGSQIVTNLQQIVSRGLDPFEKLVVSVTMFHCGTANNIIAEKAVLNGSVRSFSPAIRAMAVKQIEQIVQGVTAAHGASYKLDYDYGYDAVLNDAALMAQIEGIIIDTMGAETIEKMTPLMGGEDFSFYLKDTPGCFLFIGSGNNDKGTTISLHNPKFVLDEDAMAIGVKASVYSALKIMGVVE